METFYTRRTADYSPLVVHFTKDARMVCEDQLRDDSPLLAHRGTSAKDRLISILENKVIYSSPMPFLPTACQAVCFTECIWDGLTSLAGKYSSYGVVFSKRFVFASGGGPALYVRGDMLQANGIQIPPEFHPFIAPFDPDAKLKDGVRLDWLHEREWRLPIPLSFEYVDIEFVLVESMEDARMVVNEIGKRRLPEEKMIPRQVYQTIKETWRTQ